MYSFAVDECTFSIYNRPAIESSGDSFASCRESEKKINSTIAAVSRAAPPFLSVSLIFPSRGDLLTRRFVTQGTPRVFLTRTFLAPILIASAEFRLRPATSSFSAPSFRRLHFSRLGQPNARDFIRSIDPFLPIGSNGTLSYVRKVPASLICEINYPVDNCGWWILYQRDIVCGMQRLLWFSRKSPSRADDLFQWKFDTSYLEIFESWISISLIIIPFWSLNSEFIKVSSVDFEWHSMIKFDV